MVGNVDVTVILQTPKSRVCGRDARVAPAALGLDPGRVSVKGKTNEGSTPSARAAIAAHAIALLRATSPVHSESITISH
jgi:2C-methyl-D-erythritol 2,4-cyclodiphosphate synthase